MGALVLAMGLAWAAVPTNTLLYMESADIPTLDPGATYDTASGALVENIYETLVTYKGKSVSELQGLLATSWTISGDGKVYTFTLRKGVKFHSGNPFEVGVVRPLLGTSSGYDVFYGLVWVPGRPCAWPWWWWRSSFWWGWW